MHDDNEKEAPSVSDFEFLIDGYRRFRSDIYTRHRTRYDSLANQGQSPKVMMIACCDSRVDPTVVFDAEPGQLFVLRNVANLVPPFETGGGRHGASAAIEYAVTQLKVEHVVVFGHARCGGIQASLTGDFDNEDDDAADASFIGKWMALIKPVRDQVMMAYKIAPDIDPQRALEQAAIRQSIANLRTFPFVAEREREGVLRLHGAYFDIADGILKLLDTQSDRFEPVQMSWTED
ncbi:carbonic anhydrase [Parapedomonas caeni]